MQVNNSHTTSINFDYNEKEKLQMYSNAIVRMIEETGIRSQIQWNRKEEFHWIMDLQLYASDENYDKLQPLVNEIFYTLHTNERPDYVPMIKANKGNVGTIKEKKQDTNTTEEILPF